MNKAMRIFSTCKCKSIFLLIVSCVVIAFLYSKGQGVSQLKHEKVLQYHADWHYLTSKVSQELLETRAGLVLNYDELNTYSRKSSRLSKLYLREVDSPSQAMIYALSSLDALFVLKNKMLEQYKTKLSIFRNSANYFLYLNQSPH